MSRIFQELSNGLAAFHSATKMKEVPVPFAYVQVNALLLLGFNTITPIAIAVFSSPEYENLNADSSADSSAGGSSADSSDFSMSSISTIAARRFHVITSVLLSSIVVCGFTAMWMVANELEDPFGDDANDLQLLDYHREFCSSIDSLLLKPWLEKDHWTVSRGKWQVPRENWTMAGDDRDAPNVSRSRSEERNWEPEQPPPTLSHRGHPGPNSETNHWEAAERGEQRTCKACEASFAKQEPLPSAPYQPYPLPGQQAAAPQSTGGIEASPTAARSASSYSYYRGAPPRVYPYPETVVPGAQ